MKESHPKRVRVLVNRRSGFMWSFETLQQVFDKFWDKPDVSLTYQFCQSAEDGRAKTRRAVEQGIDVLLVVGGDGTVSTTGSVLIGTDVVLGIIPMGSGNGFARHFEIPLSPAKAIEALANGTVVRVDVGCVNGRPFLVTCSMAWDAVLVRSFDKSPVRGIVPYIFSGAYEFLGYRPEEIVAILDSGQKLVFPDPLVFTVANVTQFGGGALIAPHAKADDGLLELVVAQHQGAQVLLSNLHRVFNGTVAKMPGVVLKSFRSMIVRRPTAAPIQVDGELVEAPEEIEVKVIPKCLNVLIPQLPRGGSRRRKPA
jgi:diacylglycerol kinase family enzyme